MARLTSLPSFTGTAGPVTVYRMFGRYYIRSRSSLSARRVKTDPAFRITMQYAALLSGASRIASKVYASVPPIHKKHILYRKLTGEAMTWLKYGWSASDIIDYLLRQYGGAQLPVEAPATILRSCYQRSGRHASRAITGLVKTAPVEIISFELCAWRKSYKLFKQARHQKDKYDVLLFREPLNFST